jgi:hypothetical protein
VLEKLHRSFVLLRRVARRECSQVLAPPRFRVFLARIYSKFTGFEFLYHAVKRAREAPILHRSFCGMKLCRDGPAAKIECYLNIVNWFAYRPLKFPRGRRGNCGSTKDFDCLLVGAQSHRMPNLYVDFTSAATVPSPRSRACTNAITPSTPRFVASLGIRRVANPPRSGAPVPLLPGPTHKALQAGPKA